MNTTKKLLKKIQSVQENKLTRDVIIPLLETLGYKKVEFNGGVYEEGKDIIMWDEDRFGEIKVSVAQVKHFKLSSKASGNDSLQTVVNQLENCIKKPILNVNKKTYRPSEIILISTYPISTNTLRTRFSEHVSLKDHSIIIIDGYKLCSQIIKNRQDIVNDLLGIETNIPAKILATLNNKILLKALGYNNKISIKSIYTDINFNLGKRVPRILLVEKYDPISHKYDITLEKWLEFKRLCKSITKEYQVNFLNKPVSEIDSASDLTTYNKWRDSIQAIEIYRDKKMKKLNVAKDELQRKEQELQKIERKRRNYGVDDILFLDASELVDEAKSTVSVLEKELLLANKKLDDTRIAKPSVLYTITIDGKKISQQIIEKRKWILTEIDRINNEPVVDTIKLKTFIKKAGILISTTELLFKNPLIANCLKTEEMAFTEAKNETPRISIDVHNVFDTGLNFIVMGDAGAGKTTTLQMYAINVSQKDDKMPIWISLSRLIQYVIEEQGDNRPLDLTQSVKIYLNKLGITINKDDLAEMFKSTKTVLLLDGLDEAIKPGPWLVTEIQSFVKQYRSKVQVILSSRLSTKEFSLQEFFPITLMPFTQGQRDHFIKQWFDESKNDTIYQRVTQHLMENNEVAEIVRNPLLTTTLCVLAENNLPLPRTEINLYNNRINLLTGYYDNVKNITSRTTITPQNLETLASKLAFFLHSNSTRESDIENLTEYAIKAMKNHLGKEQSTIALQELIDPCNILIPMSKTGQYGFGHLRYQEHLAAKEILNNRSIKIPALMRNLWWKGVFIIFSKLNDNIEWLIKDLGKEDLVNKNQEVLLEMINARPKYEHQPLEAFLQKYIIAETDRI
ncbi:NACHT domain-containing protein [Sphingobacterium chuzhouense]|uniref:NACHT domain-containing protein n=1 Tax=Sphingobacterium chuzhouense TaxID=1742264 RepID=A0ABR7XSF1_9SPHI|nr:hypothetical protein [Sphingobacterium chuzhouense]MBD1421217.1 hypothetical protein [Sphingobacterium chuzhouense]